MGRGAAWPPNSFGEWMVGQNFKSTPRRASGQTQILSVSLSEDEASGDETLQITYPGRRRGISATKQPTPKSSSSRKKVSFDSGRKPLKSALKKRGVSSSESSDTLVEDTSEDVGTTEKDESSAIDESDTSGDEVWVKKKKKPKPEQKSKANHVCKKETDSEDSSAVKDALPHETCDCKDCVKGRKILKAMIKLDAKQAAEGGSKKACDEKQKHKQKGTKKNAEATSTEASETTETEATEDDKEQPSKNQKKKGQSKNNEKKPSPKENKKPSPKTAEPKQSVDKSAFKLPIYPTSMQPNLLMPIKSKVVQCEHAIEGPNDPRPNAFINSGKGIVRVYHGPVWGNHTGELYGAANPSKLSPLPPSARPYPEYPHNWAGPPHYEHFPPFPPYPPYHQRGPSPRSHPAGPPPGTPVGQNVKADQPPTGPATDGLGLSGVRWPGTPPMLRDEKAREKTKQQSEATNNVGPSQPTQDPWSRKEARNGNTDAWASGGGNQAWGNDGNAKGSGNAWGEALGGDGNTQKADFSFLKHDQPKFERSKNKSAKGSQDGGWGGGGGGNWNQQGGNQAGDAAWGEQSGNTGWNDNGNSGWNDNNGNAANENQNWGAGSNHGSQRNANNDQGWNQRGSNRNSPQGGPSWNQQGPSFNSPQEGNANNGQNWNQPGSNHNSPQWGCPWGGPPGSRPKSHHSRPNSNTGAAWDNPGRGMGHDNKYGNNNALPGHMPGSWDNPGGPQPRKHSGSNQSPQGWGQQGNGNSFPAGDKNGPGWNGSSAPQGPQFPGHGGGQGWGGGSNKGGSPAGNWDAGGAGPGGGWNDDPSNNAGPTGNSWQANVAGDTKGAATNW